MPKHDFLTPKAISNRIKSKGLQKLRWFCQMCHKQCRDANGFKCHITSESHQRQIMLAAENPARYLDAYSSEFLSDFITLLKRRFGTRRVHNNVVYNEYISDKNHVHMNSTRWSTLTGFTLWLGRKKICLVDDTPKGLYIQWIDREPDTIRKQEAAKLKCRMDVSDAERNEKLIQRQMERAKEMSKVNDEKYSCSLSEFNREVEEQIKLDIDLQKDVKPSSNLAPISNPLEVGDSSGERQESLKRKNEESTLPRSIKVLREIMEEETAAKKVKAAEEDSFIKENWLVPGIIVKIKTKRLGEKYFGIKGVVTSMKNDFVGIITLLKSSSTLKLDQEHLETVIPAIGKPVMIVNGRYRGKKGTLAAVHPEKFQATVVVGKHDVIMQYEHFSKLQLS